MLSHRKASEGDVGRLLSDGSGGGKEASQGGGISAGLIRWLPQQSLVTLPQGRVHDFLEMDRLPLSCLSISSLVGGRE